MKLGAATESILRQFCDAVVVTDAQGHITWVNPAFTQLSGYSLDEVRGEKPGTVLQGPDTDRAAIRRIHDALLARRAIATEIINYHRDGHPYCVHLTIQPLRDARGTLRGFLALERDITAKRREVSALEEEICRLYRMLVEVAAEEGPTNRRTRAAQHTAE